MKFFSLMLLSSTLLLSNGLESFLTTKDPNHKEQKENIKYLVIGKTDILAKAQKKDFQDVEVSGGVSSQTAHGFGQGFNQINTIKSNVRNYQNDEKQELIKSIKTDVLEEIVLKYFNPNTNYFKYGLKEKIIISFDIDEKNNISNIKFIQPSNYEDINNAFEEAIIKSSQELPTPKEKETKTLYYEFDI